MAAALDKYGISERLVVFLLRASGKRPSRILFSLMCMGFLLSMWVSNVAAAVLNVAVILPLLRGLPETSQWPKMALLGTAFACNIGGMSTPIASPQNVIAMIALRHNAPGVSLSFFEWVGFALPICALATITAWAWLRW
jgi:phosphate transporter